MLPTCIVVILADRKVGMSADMHDHAGPNATSGKSIRVDLANNGMTGGAYQVCS